MPRGAAIDGAASGAVMISGPEGASGADSALLHKPAAVEPFVSAQRHWLRAAASRSAVPFA